MRRRSLRLVVTHAIHVVQRLVVGAVLIAAAARSQEAEPTAPSTTAPSTTAPSTTAPSIVPPELVADQQPVYPPDCFHDGVQGPVQLTLDLDDTGAVMRVDVVTSPDPRLSWAALGAVSNFEFTPAQQLDAQGSPTPIAVRVNYTLTFTIDVVARERALAAEEALRLAQQRATAPINLRGTVVVAGEPRAVAGAVVRVQPADGAPASDEDETTTDADGHFALRGVAPGARQIVVEASGFRPAFLVQDLQSNVATDVRVYLVPRGAAGGDDETVVRERRTQREVTKRVLTQHELTRVPGTFGDAVRVVQRLPGVARAPFGLGAVLVRGGSPEDTMILIDGHITRVLFHLGAGPSVINSDLVDRLEFYPGGQGARFGRAIAGTIDVVTRDPRSDAFSGKATIDLLQTGFRLEGPLTTDGKLSFFLAGRTSYVADVLNAGTVITRFVDPDVNLLSLAPRYADYQSKLVWKLPAGHSLVLNVLGSHDVLDFALDASQLGPSAPRDVGITTGFHRINPVWRWRSSDTNDDGTPKLRAFVSPLVETTYSENRFDASQFRLDVLRTSARAELEWRPVDGVGLALGTDDTAGHYTSTADLPFVFPDERLFPRPATSDPPRTFITDDVLGTSSSFYVDSDVRLGDVTLLLGARSDLITYYDQVRASVDPRAAIRWKLLPMTTWKANVGVYHQASTPFSLAKDAGNPDLPLEEGLQYGTGIETWLTRSLDVDFQVFLRTADHLATPVSGATQFVASGAPRVQAIGHERAYGAELLVRQRLDHGVFGWVSYTLMRAEQRTDAPVGVPGAEATPWRKTQFDQTHILSIALSSALGDGWELGGAFRYVTGSPATFANGGQLDADTGRYQRFSESTRNSRLPDFLQLDARVDKRWVFDTWKLSLFCDLQNVTNRQNYEFFQYNYDFTQRQGFPGLPILPVLGAEAEF